MRTRRVNHSSESRVSDVSRNAGIESSSSNKLRLLSETEKIQLLELQKTREKILNELGKGPNGKSAVLSSKYANDPQMMLASNELSYGTGKHKGTTVLDEDSMNRKGRHAIAHRHNKAVSFSRTANYISSLKTGLDMVPIMASSGELALDIGLAGKGTIRLPVFKLPALDVELLNTRYNSRNSIRRNSSNNNNSSSNNNSNRSSGIGSRSRARSPLPLSQSAANYNSNNYNSDQGVHRFIAVADSRAFRRALLIMLRSLRDDEFTFIKYYVDVSEQEIEEIEKELNKSVAEQSLHSTPPSTQQRKRKSISSTAAAAVVSVEKQQQQQKQQSISTANSSALGPAAVAAAALERDKDSSLWTDFFGIDPTVSVFTLSKEIVLSDAAARNNQSSQLEDDYGKAISSVDLSALGLSEEFSQYLPIDNNTQKRTSQQQQQQQQQLTAATTAKTAKNTATTTAAVAAAAGRVQNRPTSTQAQLPPLKHLASMPQLYKYSVNTLAVKYNNNHNSSNNNAISEQRLRMSSSAHGHSFPSSRSNNNSGNSGNNYYNQSLSSPLLLSKTAGKATAATTATAVRAMHKKQMGISKDILDPSFSRIRPTQRQQHRVGAGELTQALLLSLSQMQQHTFMIKQSISQAQNIVNIEDPKARHLVFSVAAEKLRKALNPLLLLELRRGFTAWVFSVRQVRRQEKVTALFKFLANRNLLLGLHEMLLRRLKVNYDVWREFTAAEVLRIKKQRIQNAAVRIQTAARGRLARVKVQSLLLRRKYQRLYDATIKIQAIIRGKVTKWRFYRQHREQREGKHARLLQRVLRGYFARKRVYNIRLRHDKATAATHIQRVIRGHQAYNRVAQLLQQQRLASQAAKIQSLVRGFIARRSIKQRLIDRARYRHAARIQSLVRGVLGRMNLSRRIQELEEYRYHRYKSATKIQSAYRGYRARLFFQMMIYKVRKVKTEQFKAATQVTRVVRGFNARALLRELRRLRTELWVSQAKQWQETWSEDQENWYYYRSETDEAVWEPLREGYTRHDGMLVLASGEIIEDPVVSRNKTAAAEEGDDVAAAAGDEDEEVGIGGLKDNKKKKMSKLCTECMERVATRACNECGDKYCTKCYKYVHATGSRRSHSYAPLGPLDCTECELRLAERWCVSCDECFCDGCWRKVHGKGKRAYHPYSDISPEGRIDARIFTMDGDQVSDYDSSYSQQRMDLDSFNMKQTEVQQLANALIPVPEEQQQYAYYGEGYDGYSIQPDGYSIQPDDYSIQPDGYSVQQSQYDQYSQFDEYNNNSEYSPLSPQQSLYEQQQQQLVPYADANSSVGYGNDYDYYTHVGGSTVGNDSQSQLVSFAGWTQYSDDNGYPYWYNHDTGASQYEAPP